MAPREKRPAFAARRLHGLEDPHPVALSGGALVAVARRLAHGGGGRGCPVCAGKTIVTGEKGLAHLQPEIAAQ